MAKAMSWLRMATSLLLLLLLSSVAKSADADPDLEGYVEASSGRSSRSSSTRACTVDDLIPNGGGGDDDGDLSDLWDHSTLVTPPFDCTCATLKASYHCPHLGTEGYPKWNPRLVAHGICKPKSKSDLKHEPFPPDFKVLFYGNSHLRQVLEGIVCAYSSTIVSRRLNIVDTTHTPPREMNIAVDPGLQCRSCVSSRNLMGDFLLENDCVSEEAMPEACSCHDNESLFLFNNGAILHYHFAHVENNKQVEDALKVHGTKFSDYDAVVANPGNKPNMEVAEVLRVASVLQDQGLPLFWMSSYEGVGDVAGWLPEEQEAFWASGARFIPVHRMVESLQFLTKGVVEDEHNPHFCMPGPPNEIGVLLLKMAWALHDEKEEARREAGEEGGGREKEDHVEGKDGKAGVRRRQ
ncbi:unnamed protein product [Scytosiphon promiscuus]